MCGTHPNYYVYLLVLACALAVATSQPCNVTLSPSAFWNTNMSTIMTATSSPSLLVVCLTPGEWTGCGSGATLFPSGSGPVVLRGLDPNNRTVINCESAGRGFYLFGTATIQNVEIRNGVEATADTYGGAILATAGTLLTLDNVHMTNNSHRALHMSGAEANATNCVFASSVPGNLDGSAIYITSSSKLTLRECALYANTAGDDGVVSVRSSSTYKSYNTSYHNNVATVSGGLVYALGADVTTTFQNDTFINNKASSLVDLRLNSVGFVRNCVFRANNVTQYGCMNVLGEALYVSDSLVEGNVGGDGVCVYSSYADVFVTNTTIINNNARSAGGAARIEGGTAEFTDCTIHGNTATTHGGGLYVLSGAQVTVTHTTISENAADTTGTGEGGGVYTTGTGSGVHFVSVNITGNTASYGGGVSAGVDTALNTSGVSHVSHNYASAVGGGINTNSNAGVLEGVHFSHNDADYGGGLYVASAIETVRNCSFSHNSAGFDGAGVKLDATSGVSVFASTLFEGNTADEGAGLSVDSAAVTLSASVVFLDNTANDYGGGVQLLTSTAAVYARFESNAADAGGALYVINGHIDLYAPTVVSGNAGLVTGAVYVSVDHFHAHSGVVVEDNVATSGGAGGGGIRLVSGSGSYAVVEATIVGNSAQFGGGLYAFTGVNVSGAILTDNTADTGGGMYPVPSSGDVWVERTLFARNVATTRGGGMYFGPGGVVGIYNSVFVNNTATAWGGGIDVTAAGAVNNYLTVVNTSFVGNTANRGGGFSTVSDDSDGTIRGCTFKNNVAMSKGAGIFSAGHYINVTSCVVMSNIAGNTGGGIHGADKMRITNTVIQDNTASLGGSGISFADCRAVIVNSNITCNVIIGSALESGMQIGALASVITLNNTVVAHNYWLQDGTIRVGTQVVSDVNLVQGALHGYTPLYSNNIHASCPAFPACSNSTVCNGGGCSMTYAPSAVMSCDCTGFVLVDSSCASLVVCGDGVANITEECDDGNLDDGDACDSSCRFSCGNGYTNTSAGEECDDGNSNNYDACTNNCTLTCGDGFWNVTAGEECDDGNLVDGDGCESNCTNTTTPTSSGSPTTSSSSLPTTSSSASSTTSATTTSLSSTLITATSAGPAGYCGDGVRDTGEQCDDGNTNNCDACRSDCTRQRPSDSGGCADDEWRRKSGCEPCPEGGYCDGSTWCLPKEGYWSKSPYHTPIKCGVRDACPGVVDEDGNYLDDTTFDADGNPVTAVCGADYGDEVCAKCKGKRFKDNQRCVPCPNAVASTTSGLVVVFSALIVVVAIGVVVLSDKQLDMFVAGLLALQMFILVGRDATRFVPGGFGDRISSVYRYFSVITFDLDFLQLGCSRGQALDFVEVFWGTVALIAIAYAVFVAAALINVSLRWCRGKLKVSFRESAAYHIVHVTALLGVAAYVQVALRVIQSIDCLDVDGEARLRVELSTKCYADEHSTAATVAWLLMALYLIGFPAFVFYITWNVPAVLARKKLALSNSSVSLGDVSVLGDASYDGGESAESGAGSGVGSVSEHSSAERVSEEGGSEEEEQYEESYSYSSGNSMSELPVDSADARAVYVYRAKYGFLIRNLHRHAYWFQALRLAVLFVVVLELVTPHSTSAKLFGGVIILASNVVVVGLVWPFKSRLVNVFQMGSGLVTACQTVLFITGVADPRGISTPMFVLSLVAVAAVGGVMVANLYYNKSLLVVCGERWGAAGSSSYGSSSSSSSSRTSETEASSGSYGSSSSERSGEGGSVSE